ncbi:MAG: DUF4143 domain-containing protein, partial [Spirochaetales bacterium]|nr:DUF4143 domain-containing protein [Spirochaetales bacterium]
MPEPEKKYRGRVVDKELGETLGTFGGVLITGPKMCGKTWTGIKQAASSVFIDDGENLTKAALTPEALLEGPSPRLVDEWQLAPLLWDKARRLIDKAHKPGRFIFTGSAVPAEAAAHSGTGRFVHLQMRPMTLFESGDSSGSVSLAALFAQKTGKKGTRWKAGKPLQPAPSTLDFKTAVHLICRGGWPAGLWLKKNAALALPKGYLEMIIETDVSRLEGAQRNPSKLRLLMKSLARNSSTQAGASVILGDIQKHEEAGSLSEDSIANYIDALKKIFIIDEQKAWLPSLRSKTRIRTRPKRHFVDPSLAAAALDASPSLLMGDPKTTGFLFESLCYRDLSVYARPIKGEIYHYRDEKGLEVDIIIQLKNGNWAAVEVKLGSFEFDSAAENLIKLRKKMEGQTT